MKNKLLLIILLFSFISCQTQKTEISKEYPRMIGDIAFNTSLDDENFKLCNDEKYAVQYYAFNKKPYLIEKRKLFEIFNQRYDNSKVKKEGGLIRIRFIVNCKGEAGRFRVLASDSNYQEKIFDKSITNQLLKITKSIKEWKSFERNGIGRDYYNHLIFKIEKGVLKEILP